MSVNNNQYTFLRSVADGELSDFNNLDGETILKLIQAVIKNYYTVGYDTEPTPVAAPFGYLSVPNDKAQAVGICLEGSNKQQLILAFINKLPTDTPIELQKGESGHISNNWGLFTKNNKVMAYKLDDEYTATLMSGEWGVHLETNRINELKSVVQQLNNDLQQLKTQFNAHIHPTPDGNSGAPTLGLNLNDIVIPDTADQDLNHLGNGNVENAVVLLNNKAQAVNDGVI